jgi:cell division septum initiation protein DivIVA
MEGNMNIEDLLNELEEIINESQHVPLTQLVIVAERQVFDIIDRTRALVRTKQPPRSDTTSIPTGMTQQMREQGLLSAADLERTRIIEAAQQEADEIRAGADEYAREVLEELQGRLDRIMLSVQNGLKELDRLQRPHLPRE